jgi:hypothetical protein
MKINKSGYYTNKLNQVIDCFVIEKGDRLFDKEKMISRNTVKIMVPDDPRHIYTVWEDQVQTVGQRYKGRNPE